MVMQTLEETGVVNDTMIVVMADHGGQSRRRHVDWPVKRGVCRDCLWPLTCAVTTPHALTGWQLGEHAEWGKHTNWELASMFSRNESRFFV
jgi:arylsulfatase A-like enzyme